jgi:hypothetical protein
LQNPFQISSTGSTRNNFYFNILFLAQIFTATRQKLLEKRKLEERSGDFFFFLSWQAYVNIFYYFNKIVSQVDIFHDHLKVKIITRIKS